MRVLTAHVQALAKRKPAIERYMKAYRETVEYMYSDPAALKIYAEFIEISDAKAKRSRDDFFPRQSIDPDTVVGLDVIVADAVNLKFTTSQLSKPQLAELIQIPPR